MLEPSRIKTIFFDFDGTLHNNVLIYAPAFRKAFEFLVSEGHCVKREWSDEEISYWLGFNKEEMWKSFMPDLNPEIQAQAGQIIGHEMNFLLQSGAGKLYDGVHETLGYLKAQNYHLVFLSNCSLIYQNLVRALFDLDHYFEGYACAEAYGYKPKWQILSEIKESYPVDWVVIGDRFHDVEAAKMNQIPVIGCLYGYANEGELDQADLVIREIRELMTIF